MSHSAPSRNTNHTLHPSNPSHTGSPSSCIKSNRQLPKHTSTRFDPTISKTASAQPFSTTHASTSSSEAVNVYTGKESAESGYLSPMTSFSGSRGKRETTSTVLTSKPPSVWHLLDSYDLVNLHGKPGMQHPRLITSQGSTSNSSMIPSISHSLPPKPTPSTMVSSSTLHKQPHLSALSKPSPDSFKSTPGRKANPCSHGLSAHSTDSTSSTKSRSSSFKLASAPSVSQVTPFVKGRRSQPPPTASPRKTSNYLGDGRAMLYINELSQAEHSHKLLSLNSQLHTISNPTTTSQNTPPHHPYSTLPWL